MRILVLGKYYPPFYGGIETVTRNVCEGLVSLGAEVECVVAHDQPRTVREEIHGVRVKRHARWGVLASTAICPGYLAAALPGWAEVIQLHFPNPLADLALWLRNRRQTPLVITYHSDIVRQARWMRGYLPLFRWLLRRAARIVVATPPQLDASPWLAPWRSKCEIIPFGLDLERFERPAAVPPAVAEARSAAGARPVLLNVGRLVPYKGQRHLIEAMVDLDAVAWIVGTGPLAAELHALVEGLRVAPRVRFWGDVADEALPAMMQQCDIFVLPSVTPNEAFGLVQVEAMACGKPVISCRLPSGVPYVNQDGVTGVVVPPGDSRALAAATQLLLANPSERGRLGSAGRRRAREEFSLPVMGRRYWELFARVARAGRLQ